MENQTQIIAKINDAKNILITVGHSPSVDVLTACLGLTLAIDKLKKHSAAIFSGKIPPIMTFLHPERTFENSTESFQDFIISLDKDKADKLRYKVEGDLVKIFITPYHTTISPADLKFETGEMNVDLIIALGVKEQGDIDKAALAHGKILHSAPIITINAGIESSLGSINAKIDERSGYCETIAKLIIGLDEKLLSKQISTALLTGIVIETAQFSNAKTTPDTMTIASKLLSSGADQQLIVKEIRGSGSVSEAPVDTVQEIPEVAEDKPVIARSETTKQSSTTSAGSPRSARDDVAEEPVYEEPVESLEDFMPPPLTGLTGELPPPPDITAPEFVETISTVPTEVIQPEPTESLPPPPDDAADSIPTPPESIPEPPVAQAEPTPTPATSSADPTQFRIPA